MYYGRRVDSQDRKNSCKHVLTLYEKRCRSVLAIVREPGNERGVDVWADEVSSEWRLYSSWPIRIATQEVTEWKIKYFLDYDFRSEVHVVSERLICLQIFDFPV